MRGILRTHFRREADLAVALSGPAVEDGTVGVVCDRRGAVEAVMMKIEGRAARLFPPEEKEGRPVAGSVLSCEVGTDSTPNYKAVEVEVMRGYGATSRAEAKRRIYAHISDILGGE